MRANYASIVYMNFMEQEKNIQRVKDLNSQDILESPVLAVRIIERIFDSFFSFLTYEKDRELPEEKLNELMRMKKVVKKAVFTDSYDCFGIWKDLDSIFKENQWTFDALEYMEIYLATQKQCITAYAKGKIVFGVFEHITSVLAEASRGDKEVFSKSIKEYNDLTTICVDFNEEEMHPLYSENPLREKRLFVKQRFLKYFDPEIPLELWLNIYFDATREETNIFTESFQSKEFTNFLKEINRNKKLANTSITTPISG